jgi:hypothetical protein
VYTFVKSRNFKEYRALGYEQLAVSVPQILIALLHNGYHCVTEPALPLHLIPREPKAEYLGLDHNSPCLSPSQPCAVGLTGVHKASPYSLQQQCERSTAYLLSDLGRDSVCQGYLQHARHDSTAHRARDGCTVEPV